MTGAKTSEHDFSSVHGSTSSGDDFDGIEDSTHYRPVNVLDGIVTGVACVKRNELFGKFVLKCLILLSSMHPVS